ncbi:MAG TPA: fumarylacetoacetate hydrolase family protein [Steroidobacteraceae bacterium]
MKLASFAGPGRDGALVVVSRDLARAASAADIAPTLQAALDGWARLKPALESLARELEAGRAPARPFNPKQALAPLPRAYHWVDGSAYVNHVELVRKARGAEMPASFWTDPLVYQGGSDDFLPPTADAPFGSEDWGIDIEGEVAVVTDDVPMGTDTQAARGHIVLLMLVNDWSLRNLIPAELAKGFGFYQSKPATAFSPVAVTPDELGDAWQGARVHRPLTVQVNGKPFGQPDAGTDMTFDFGQLIAHAAKTRRLGAGAIVGSGTVSNYDRSKGSTCIAERRMLETLEQGKPVTPFLSFGDRVRIEMFDAAGRSIFGAIDQRVARAS